MTIANVILNVNDKWGVNNLSNNGLTVTSDDQGNIRATHGKSYGKWYWEVKIDSGSLSTFVGIANKNYPITSIVYNGTTEDVKHFRGIYFANGNKVPEYVAYGTVFAINDVLGIALDLDNFKIEFYKNGVNLGVSHTNLLGMGEVFPLIKSWDNLHVHTINFGAKPFSYSIPTGFLPYGEHPIYRFLFETEDLNTVTYNKTENKIVELLSQNERNFIKYGVVDDLSSIDMSRLMDIKEYTNENGQIYGEGKTFEHIVDLFKYDIKKITFK